MDSIVTIFQDLNNQSTPFHKPVSEILNRIKTGKKSKTIIKKIRNEENEEKKQRLKESLPVICFSAELYKISDDAIINHSGIICLDFNGYDTEFELEEAVDEFKSNDYVYSVFKSVSGNGLKILVKIPASIEMHRKLFKALESYLGSKYFDKSCFNESRACYESYDPDIYVNDDSLLWDVEEDFSEGVDIESASGIEDIAKTPVRHRTFWGFTDKGKVFLDEYKFKEFMVDNGFHKFYPMESKNFVFVRKISNRVKNVFEYYIKDFVLDYIEDNVEDRRVWNFFASKTSMFKEDFLSCLPGVKLNFVTDHDSESYVFYSNVAVLVTAKKVRSIEYEDLSGWVWEDQIIDRAYRPVRNHDCDFKKFVSNISGADEGRIKSIESTIGFLLHTFKNKSKCPAVILNDETISDNPEGGTGKGLLCSAISQLRKQVTIDGKRFDFGSSFPYQRVQQDTQILVFDDVKPNFKFENLFSVITEGIELEKKNKDQIKIPFKDAPKIILTTNYAISGKGGSYDRRRCDVELKQRYNKGFTPEAEFGRRFFDGWDEKEWVKFDNYMLSNLQLHIKEGLIESDFGNLKIRKFISDTCFEFYEWITDESLAFSKPNVKNYLNAMKQVFTEEYPDYSRTGKFTVSSQKFGKWIDSYGEYEFGQKPKTDRDSLGKWFEFGIKTNKQLKTGI